MENYEIVCENCGKVFESDDEMATLCNDCWIKIVNLDKEGKGDE